MRGRLVLVLAVAGCNPVFGLDPVDEQREIDARVVDAEVAVDAVGCQVDEFEGTALEPHWTPLAGGAPVANVAGSRLLISDAPFAATPSTPTTSWIYELDVDRGNQLGWSQEIGAGDFTVDADLAWMSTAGEVTLAGVGVSEPGGGLIAWLGVQDGNAAEPGTTAAHLRAPGPDQVARAIPMPAGGAHIRIARSAGAATLSLDGVAVLIGEMPDLVGHVSIMYVRHKQGITSYTFGSLEVLRIEVCR